MKKLVFTLLLTINIISAMSLNEKIASAFQKIVTDYQKDCVTFRNEMCDIAKINLFTQLDLVRREQDINSWSLLCYANQLCENASPHLENLKKLLHEHAIAASQGSSTIATASSAAKIIKNATTLPGLERFNLDSIIVSSKMPDAHKQVQALEFLNRYQEEMFRRHGSTQVAYDAVSAYLEQVKQKFDLSDVANFARKPIIEPISNPSRDLQSKFYSSSDKQKLAIGAGIAVASAAILWVSYAAKQVAKNISEQEWQSLRPAEKIKRVMSGIPQEMRKEAKIAFEYSKNIFNASEKK